MSDFLLPMLRIYPEDRAGAFEMIRHPWISYQSRDKNHICDTPEENLKELESQHAFIKSKCVFYRELKEFDEEKNDADCGESDDDDEIENQDVGFRNL